MSAGHIRPRGPGAWELKYDLGRDLTGKRQIRYRTVHGAKRDAQRELRELLGTVDKGQHVDPGKLTVGELVAERVTVWRTAGKISALSAERQHQLAKSQIGRIGHIPCQRLGTPDVERWHGEMLAAGLSPRTIRGAHGLLSRALDDALKHDLVHRNVARVQRPPRAPRQDVEILHEDQIADVLAKLADHQLHPAVVTALYTGLRRGEQLALRWSDVDLDAKTLSVERALEETLEGIAIKGPKSEAGRRAVTLPDVVVDVLRDHRRQQLEQRLMLRQGRLPDDALVFPTPEGKHQSPRCFSARWRRLVIRLGLPPVKWHALRHSHASMLIDAKVDVATIAKRLGHSSPMVTLSVYAHCFRRDDRAAADAINALVR